MGTIMQRLRDRIYNQTFIILPRQPEENSNQNDAISQNESTVNDSAKDCPVDSKSENQKISPASINKEELSSTECNKVLQKKRGNDSLKSSEMKEVEVYVKKLFADLKHENSIETRCSGALNLAVCLAIDSPDFEISDCLDALQDLCDSYNFPQLAVSHALLLCGFTKMSMSLEDLIRLEASVVTLTEYLKRKNITKMSDVYKVGVLIEEHEEITLKLCQKVFQVNYLDVKQIDVLTICCCALYNISSLVKQYDNDLGATYNFKDSTLKYILVMTGRSTQEIVSEDLNSNQRYSCPSMSLFRLKQCLHVLEHALSITPDLSFREALHHESSSLPHCLTRLLGWSVSSVFPNRDETCAETVSTDSKYFPFHLSTLVSILKILSILSFNPHQYDSFPNVKGLMEKILICALKAYFESEKSHFDIQILCLEMLINLYIKNQKTFILLCLKRFRISDTEEVLAVEALLKMLSDNLEKIKEVKGQYPQGNNKDEPSVNSKESNKDVNEDSQKEDAIKKPRKETVVNLAKEDAFNKNVRKETSEEVTSEDPIKKPRKETSEAVPNEKTNEEPQKEVSSNEASKGKPEKESSAETDAVLQAASKDMEHSTIVSFICVLIVFFMRTKQNFKEFILERLTADSLREATTVSQKFLEFASLTGGMPVTGILILSQTITKLQSLQSS